MSGAFNNINKSSDDRDYNFINHNYFVISSDNCKSIASCFYGYAIIDNKLYINKLDHTKFINNLEYGFYVNIIDNDDDIIIQQDYYGMYGLFLYNTNNYFAVSNSLLMLINHLRANRMHMSINKMYCNSFLFTTTSLSFKNTIVNEIEHIPHFYLLRINKIRKTIDKVQIPLRQYNIDIDSQKGIELIDLWHDKWYNIINYFINGKKEYTIDISGGFDSRGALSILYNKSDNDYNIKDINLYSYEIDDYQDDFHIARQISDKLGFEINKKAYPPTNFISLFMCIANTLLNRLTLHNELAFYSTFMGNTLFYFGGGGGEYFREHWDEPISTFILGFLRGDNTEFHESIIDSITESIYNIKKYYRTPFNEVHSVYECCRGRLHFGTGIHTQVLANRLAMCPFLDPMLIKLNLYTKTNQDHNILMAILYDRFLELIKDMKFDHNREISHFARKYAHDLNQQFPYTYSGNINFMVATEQIYYPSFNTSRARVIDYLIELVKSDEFKHIICRLYGKDTYEKYLNNFKCEELFLLNAYYINHNVAAFISTYIAYLAMNHKLSMNNNDEIVNKLLMVGLR